MGIAFSANLGFLWTDRPIADAIRAAARAGFDAVEMHAPDAADADAIRAALDETGLPLISINTWPGQRDAGEFGLAALPERRADARAAIANAVNLAKRLGAGHVHVMAGRTDETDAALRCFCDNLRYATELAAPAGVGILIEPINRQDVPGYFLDRAETAAAIIAGIEAPNLRIMFDCYHAEMTGGDALDQLIRHLALIGHIQIAAVPSRAEPDRGRLDYFEVFSTLERLGYRGFVGAEYRPQQTVEAGLGWLERCRRRADSLEQPS